MLMYCFYFYLVAVTGIVLFIFFIVILFFKMNCDNIAKQLEYDESFSDSSFDDDIQDPDYIIIENDELGGILAFDSDPDDNFELLPTTPSGSVNIISESSEYEQPISIRNGKKRINNK